MFEIADFRQNREVLEEVWEKGFIVSPPVSQFSFEIPLGKMVKTGKADSFLGRLQRLLQKLSKGDYRSFSEKPMKMTIMAYVMQTELFYIQSEREVKGGGISI